MKFLISLFLVVGYSMPVIAEEVNQRVVQQSSTFSMKSATAGEDVAYKFEVVLPLLKQYYKDEYISSAIDRALADPTLLAKTILSRSFLLTGSPFWLYDYREALTCVVKSDWVGAQESCIKARIADAHPRHYSVESAGSCANIPNLLLLQAVIDKGAGRDQMALADITEVYELHKLAPTLWNTDCELFNTKTEVEKNER